MSRSGSASLRARASTSCPLQQVGSGPWRRHKTPLSALTSLDFVSDPELMDLARIPRCWLLSALPFSWELCYQPPVTQRVLSDSKRDKGPESCQIASLQKLEGRGFFSLLKDHELLATDPPLFRIYIIRTRLQATTKL